MDGSMARGNAEDCDGPPTNKCEDGRIFPRFCQQNDGLNEGGALKKLAQAGLNFPFWPMDGVTFHELLRIGHNILGRKHFLRIHLFVKIGRKCQWKWPVDKLPDVQLAKREGGCHFLFCAFLYNKCILLNFGGEFDVTLKAKKILQYSEME
jgi:hypothetical protein